MVFIRQFSLPDNEVVRKNVTSATMVYLFAIREPVEINGHRGFELQFEVVTRQTDVQTAEDHYREEEQRWTKGSR